MEQQERQAMDRLRDGVKWWQFLVGLVGLFITLYTFFGSIKSNFEESAAWRANMNYEVDALKKGNKEKQDKDDKDRERLESKIEKLVESNQQILILMQNKQDRK